MKKILLCEDEIDAQQSLKSILTKRNYEVLTVNDGKDALDKAKEFKPDLVLLDIRLPKIDGLEVAREIRTFDKTTKLIFLTAFTGHEIQKEASHYNITDYINKPIVPDELIKKIEAALK